MSHPSATPLPLSPAASVVHTGLATVQPAGLGDVWRGDLLRALILAEKRSVKLDRTSLLQLLARVDTAEQILADLVAMFTETEATS